jgi:hypothetical protein
LEERRFVEPTLSIMDMDPMSDDSLYPAPGTPPELLSRSPSIGHDISNSTSHKLAWDEYQRDRQAAEVHSESLVIEEIKEDDMGYDGDVEVIYPDAYEEPDAKPVEKAALHREALEHDVVWQSGIVDHMETLDCNSDANDSPRRNSWLKGRKRRSKTTSEIKRLQQQNSAVSSDFEVSEIFDDDGRFSPKRVRRRSRNLHQKIWASPDYQMSSREQSRRRGDAQGASTLTPEPVKSGNEDAMDID